MHYMYIINTDKYCLFSVPRFVYQFNFHLLDFPVLPITDKISFRNKFPMTSSLDHLWVGFATNRFQSHVSYLFTFFLRLSSMFWRFVNCVDLTALFDSCIWQLYLTAVFDSCFWQLFLTAIFDNGKHKQIQRIRFARIIGWLFF